MTAPCNFLLGALLAVVASAQWPRLPKIDPGHIAGVVKSAEKEVKQTLSQKEKQALASEVAKKAKDLHSQAPSVADNVAQSAAQAVAASAQTAEAAKTIAGDAQAQQHGLASEVAKQAKDFRSQAPSVADNVAQSAVQAVAQGAVQAVAGAAQTAGAAKAIGGDVRAQQQVGVIGGPAALATTPPAPAPVISEGSHEVHTSLQDAHDVVKATEQQVGDLASKGHDLVSKIIPGLNPSKVTGGVNKLVDGASKHIEAVKPMIHEVLNSDPKKAALAAEKGVKHVGKIDLGLHCRYVGASTVVCGDPVSATGLLRHDNTFRVWQWSLLFIVGIVGALFFGWQVTKRRDARSPALLSTGRQMQPEEVLFQQF
jgi:hypothetical protein